MTSTVIDIAWDRPTTAQIKALGVAGVIRYFSSDPTKNLTAAEVTDYHAAGLGVGTVFEDSATRALAGYAAGVADAQKAETQRRAVGLPADQVIHFAVDTDTTWTAVEAYFAGAHSVLGNTADGLRRTGVYGGIKVVDGAAAAGYHYLWQTLAWSAGQLSSHATLYQNGRTQFAGQADVNQVLAADWGQYPRPVPPKPPAPQPTFLEDDMLAYLPLIAADTDVDVPVEPAGTLAAPQGAVKNGPIYLCLQTQGSGTATVTLSLHQGGKLVAQKPATLTAGGPKGVFGLPTDGSVDFVRIHSTQPLIGYVTGRQV